MKNHKLKLYSLASFLGGVCLTAAVYWGNELLVPKTATLEETVLAEMLYDNFQRYSDDCHLNNISNVMRQIDRGIYTKVDKGEYEKTLLQLVTKKANRVAKVNLQKSEQFLSFLAQKDHILPVVDKKIYIEILEEGTGEAISSESTLSVYLKQSDETGKIIKDTGNSEPSNIVISKMVKGFKIGIEGAKVGERRKIYIHPSYGFTKTKHSGHLLIYEVSILENKG